MNDALTTLWRAKSGVAAVEFALVLPLFLVLMICMVDLALAYHAKLKISGAVSAASYYAFQKGQDIDTNTAAAYMSEVSGVISNMLLHLNAELTVEVKFNDKITGVDASKFYCVSGYPPVYSRPSTSSVSCDSNVMSGKFMSIRVVGRILPIFVAEEIFGGYLNVAVTSLVRLR